MDVLRDHRRSDLRHDLDDHRVRCNAKTDEHCDHRLRVGDRHRMDFRDVDDRNLGVSRVNRNCVRRDLNLVVKMDVSRGLRMNDQLDDLNSGVTTDVNRDLHMNDPLDGLNSGVTTDVNRDLHMNDPLDGHLKDDDRHDALVDHRMNAMDDLKMGANHVNRNCVRHDLNLGVTMDANLCHRTNGRLDGH